MLRTLPAALLLISFSLWTGGADLLGQEVGTEKDAEPKALEVLQGEEAEKAQNAQKAAETVEQIDNAGSRQVSSVSRVESWNEFRNRQGPSVQDTTVFRVDYSFNAYAFFRADVPFVYFDPNDGTGTSNFGLGDITFRVGSRFFRGPHFFWSGTFDLTLDTARGEDLGGGKKVVTPGIEATATLRPIRSTFTFFLQYNKDIAGDDSRSAVNYLRYRFTLDTDINQIWVTTFEPYLYQDFEADKVGMVTEIEVLRKFGSHWRAYARGGFHLFGEGLRGMYDWMTQFGVKFVYG